MKKVIIITFCLLSFFVEGQQTKTQTDSSWTSLKKNLNAINKNLKEAQKRAEKKVAQVEVLTKIISDTVLIDLDYEDSLKIYKYMKVKIDSQAAKEPKKEKHGFFNFLKKKSK